MAGGVAGLAVSISNFFLVLQQAQAAHRLCRCSSVPSPAGVCGWSVVLAEGVQRKQRKGRPQFILIPNTTVTTPSPPATPIDSPAARSRVQLPLYKPHPSE